MSNNNKAKRAYAATLTKERVIIAAIKLADDGGIEAMSMRKLGRELGVEAMAIYYHFADKNQLIEGMIDYVHKEIDLPADTANWRDYMESRAASAFEVLLRHPWAPPIMEASLSPGPFTLRDSENMIKCFREAGFSIAMTVHAVTVLNTYIYGAAMQYTRLSFDTAEQAAELGESVRQQLPVDAYPYLSEMITQHMLKAGYDPNDEFKFGLSLIINGIAKFKSEDGSSIKTH